MAVAADELATSFRNPSLPVAFPNSLPRVYRSCTEKSQVFTIRDKDDNSMTHWYAVSFNPSSNVIWFCWLLLHNMFCFMGKLSRQALKCCHVE